MNNSRHARRSLRQFLPVAAITALAITTSLPAQEAAPATPPATPPAPERPGAAGAANPEAEKAWQDLAAQQARPVPPSGWSRETPPKEEELAKWQQTESERLLKVAKQAADFRARYPDHEKAEAASRKYSQALEAASRLGNEEAGKHLAAAEEELLKSGNLSEDERFGFRARQVMRTAQSQTGRDAAVAAFEKGTRELIKEFPQRPEPYSMLAQLAEGFPPEKGRAILQEIVSGNAPEDAKKEAQTALKRMDAVGKPVDIKFTAIDGREIDVQAMKGKVLLIDFWATWCGPCVAEIPNVKATYDKLHPKGFEIIGISFDQEKSKLESFVKEKQLGWPQYFDGKGWENKFGQEFGIRAIPTMWLVDKQGILRDMTAREGLEEKVTKLLAE